MAADADFPRTSPVTGLYPGKLPLSVGRPQGHELARECAGIYTQACHETRLQILYTNTRARMGCYGGQRFPRRASVSGSAFRDSQMVSNANAVLAPYRVRGSWTFMDGWLG